MANLFYKRFVPPSDSLSLITKDIEAERSPKRRKSSKSSSTHPTLPVLASDIDKLKPEKESLAHGNTNLDGQQDQTSKPTLNGEFKPQRGVKSKPSAHAPPSPSPEPDTKHEKLRSKYRKAVKRTRKLQQDEAISSEPQGNDEPTGDSQTHGLVPIPQPEQHPPSPRAAVFSALPEWLRNPKEVSSRDTASFSDFPIPQRMLEALHKRNYSSALPIQAALLPMLLPGPNQYQGDICISAATGSGKTLAYALPMVEALKEKPTRLLRGLVIVPTRELVAQAREAFLLCTHGSSLNIEMALGTRSLKEEKELLIQKGERLDPLAHAKERHEEEKADEDDELLFEYDIYDESSTSTPLPGYVTEYHSNVDILITTPGRLVEHMHSTPGFTLQHIQWLVIDETDRLLDDSFQQWVDTVIPQLEALPPLDEMQERVHRFMRIFRRREVRKILLSATMTRDVGKLAALKLKAPKMVVLEVAKSDAMLEQKEPKEVDGETFTLPETLIEIAVPVEDSGDKPLYLIEILEKGLHWPQPLAPPKEPEGETSSENVSTSSDGTSSSSASDDDSTSTSSSSSPSTPPTRPHPPSAVRAGRGGGGGGGGGG